MRILVTGGCGFIGSALVRFLLGSRRDIAVVNLDALTYSGNLDNLEGLEHEARHVFVEGDVRDEALVRRLAADCDAVLHLAAESHVDRSIADPRPFMETNVVGTQVLLDAVRAAWAGTDAPHRRVVIVSTDEVYGAVGLDAPGPLDETAPLRPGNAYAASKAAGDLVALAARHVHGMNVVIVRATNNFGPRQFPEKIIPLFVTNLLQGRTVPLYGDGRHVRDWLAVDDCCEGIWLALEKGRAGEIYNVAGGNQRDNLALTRDILRLLGHGEASIARVPDRLGHDLRYWIDDRKARTELGYLPSRSAWPEALAATVEWYRDNERWWRRVMSGEYRRGRHASA